jgi:hypothetical protein
VAVTSERAGEYRRQARECLAVARTVVNAQARASLETMAQVWLRLADQLEPPGLRPPAAELDGARPVAQQQQQPQPQVDKPPADDEPKT